ncbi:MAG: cupin-like domain-containing protein [Coleofasciculaceae cyanobacterium]
MLSDEWYQWVIENKLRNIPADTLIQTMVDKGIDLHLATAAVNNTDSEPLIEKDYLRLGHKLTSLVEIYQKLAELSANFGKIERRQKLSRQEFLENYYATNTPVIITEMMDDWQAMTLWSADYLKSNYGQAEVEIQVNRNSDPEYEINSNHHKKIVQLRDYVDLILRSRGTNDYYMVANNGNLEREELKGLLNEIKPLPEFLDKFNTRGRVFFWFGPAGTITPLHHDPLNLIMAHVSGHKRWRLISPNQTPLVYNHVGVFSQVDLENPDYDKYPLFKNVKVLEVVLEPGEMIFVPVGWWHQVKALDISIAVSFTNFVFPNQFNYQDS